LRNEQDPTYTVQHSHNRIVPAKGFACAFPQAIVQKNRYPWPSSRAKQHDLFAPRRTQLVNSFSLLQYHAPSNSSVATKEEQIIVHGIPLLRNIK
jgi:hypothetical protein